VSHSDSPLFPSPELLTNFRAPIRRGFSGQRRGHRERGVNRAGAHQGVADFQRLPLAGVGLRDQELIDIDAELSGIDRIERVLSVDEGADAAFF